MENNKYSKERRLGYTDALIHSLQSVGENVSVFGYDGIWLDIGNTNELPEAQAWSAKHFEQIVPEQKNWPDTGNSSSVCLNSNDNLSRINNGIRAI